MRSRAVGTVGLVAVLMLAFPGWGCMSAGDNGGNGGEERTPPPGGGGTGCDFTALAAQCPPSSRPLFGEDAAVRCRQGIEGGEGYETGLDAGFCGGQGLCVFACNFENPCDCGVDRVTTEGVFCVNCADASACGNGICEPGESPETCPVDCAPVCTSEDQRCNGTDVETCVGGRWTREECQVGSACFFFGGQQRAWCAPRAAVFEEGLSTLEPPRVPATDWREYVYPRGQLRCDGWECLHQRFLEGGDASLVRGFNVGRGTGGFERYDHEARVFAPLTIVPPIEDELRGEACTAARQPTEYVDPQTGGRTPLETFVDDTVPLVCRSWLHRPSLDRVYATMTLDGRFELLGIWQLSTGRLLRVLRFADPEMDVAEHGLLHVSEDGALALQSFTLASSAPGGRPTRTVVWNVERGTYAGVLEQPVRSLQPGGHRVLVAQGEGQVLDMATGEVWMRPRGETLHGFTPDGRFVHGVSPDVHGVERLALFSVDDGRLFHRFPMQGEGRFSVDGRWLLVGTALFSNTPGEW